jgi:threonine dehydrogenase-like Zn-dependent dehydrogenase
MRPFVKQEMPDVPVSTRLDVVASLLVDSVPLIHLARVDGSPASSAAQEPAYAVGIPLSKSVTWHSVGHLNLGASRTPRVLLAGLSALALKHVREADVQIGDAVMVFGVDPWSLLVLQWARLQGASPLVFACRGPRALGDSASLLGVDDILSNPSQSELARAVTSTHRGGGFAVALDAVADEQSMRQALSILRDGGRYVLAGFSPQPHVMLNAYLDLHRRDLEMVSPMHSTAPFAFAELFRFSLDLAEQGRLQLDGLLDQALGWRARVESSTP